ncbi:MAG: carboxy terminal-processing peptidase [Bacteroidota bacterium]|nr:carboxy terminal-processing peptidase [Bacteroidota bacterium]
MKYSNIKYLLIAILFLGISSFSLSDDDPKKRKLIISLLINALEKAHYDVKLIDNTFSENVFDAYMERLDYNKRYFLQSDIDEFTAYKYAIDEAVKEPNLEFLNLTTRRYKTRLSETEKYISKILKTPIDFTIEESILLEPEKKPYPKNKKELKENWRKYIKYQVMTKLADKMDEQEKAKADNDTSVEIKSFEALEEEAGKDVKKTFDDWYHRMSKINGDDIASQYINAITAYYDPHTFYFPPKDKENFDISMSGKLEGIGATLSQPNAYIKVVKIIAGSPCWKQGDLEAGDKILKVAQDGENPVNVVDMRLDEAIKMIRGKKGTKVILTVKKQDGTIMDIPIIRDVIELEATFARSYIIDTGEEKIGYLYLPKFYTDFKNKNGRSSSKDVKKELLKLKEQNIDKLIFDMRNNGGGSLIDAVDITGFFIKKGPVVQVRPRYGETQTMSDSDKSIVFDGKLLVMVNENSASASEITAAALQDYNRAIVLGSSSTFGKGTVQRVLPFDRMIRNHQEYKPLGALKITVQKFYRINGGSTQLKGVIPDIRLPNIYSQIKTGEKDMDNPIGWDEITRADYSKAHKVDNKLEILENSEQRVSEDTIFQRINAYADYLKDKQEQKEQTLNLSKYREEQKSHNNKYKNYKSSVKFDSPHAFNILTADSVTIANDSVALTRYRAGLKKLESDIYLNEAVEVLDGAN